LKGYDPCHNSEEVIESIGYDPERDPENPTGSVFCANGTGFLVDWDKVKEYMHVEGYLPKGAGSSEPVVKMASYQEERQISKEEIDHIISRTFYANQGRKSAWKRRIAATERHYKASTDRDHETSFERSGQHAAQTAGQGELKEEFLLVDGYNIIHAWPELKEHADENMDGARMKLIDLLSNYQGMRKCRIIVVFDAYRVQRQTEEVIDYYNLHLVYTKEAQTADQYIEKFAHDNKRKYHITVATSDGLQQMIIRGAGCFLLSARELKAEMEEANERLRKEYNQIQRSDRNRLFDALSPEAKQQLEELMNKE
jgi:predicted RNA-binding protein with PIN domain